MVSRASPEGMLAGDGTGEKSPDKSPDKRP